MFGNHWLRFAVLLVLTLGAFIGIHWLNTLIDQPIPKDGGMDAWEKHQILLITDAAEMTEEANIADDEELRDLVLDARLVLLKELWDHIEEKRAAQKPAFTSRRR